jgi:hypothetical protein
MVAPFKRGPALPENQVRITPPDYSFAFSAPQPNDLLKASKPVCYLSTRMVVRPEILEFCPSTPFCFALQSCVVAMLLFLACGFVPRSHLHTRRRPRLVKFQAQKPAVCERGTSFMIGVF